MTPRCISGSVPPRDKISTAIPMFTGVNVSAVPKPTFTGDSFTATLKMAAGNRK